MCPTQRLEVEAAQRKALDMLTTVFYAEQYYAESWQSYMNQTLEYSPTLSGFYSQGQFESAPQFTFMDFSGGNSMEVQMQFQSTNGAFYITHIASQGLGVVTPELVKMLPKLPFLKSFSATVLGGGFDLQQPLPIQLAAVAPSSLKVFQLSGLNLCCSWPEEWGSWDTIVELAIKNNGERLTGPLRLWAGMKSLKSLDLSFNDFTGTLPASYGTAIWSKSLQSLKLMYSFRLAPYQAHGQD